MNISDVMAELKRLQKKINSPTLLINIGVILLLVALSFVFRFMWMLILVVVFPCMSVSSVTKKVPYTNKYKRLYKEELAVRVLSEHMTDLQFDTDTGFLNSEIEGFGLIKIGNHVISDNYLRGMYKDLCFRQARVVSEYSLTSYKSTYNPTDQSYDTYEKMSVTSYFNGQVFELDMPHSRVSGLQIYSNTYANPVNPPMQSNMQTVKTGYDAFDQAFTIRVAEKEDLQILTLDFMDFLLELNKQYKSVVLYITVCKMLIGLDGCKKTFEPPKKGKLEYPTERTRIMGDARITMDLLDAIIQSNSSSRYNNEHKC